MTTQPARRIPAAFTAVLALLLGFLVPVFVSPAAPAEASTSCQMLGGQVAVCSTVAGDNDGGGPSGGPGGGGGGGGGSGGGCDAACVDSSDVRIIGDFELFPWDASQRPNGLFPAALMSPHYGSEGALMSAECGGRNGNALARNGTRNVGFYWAYRIGNYNGNYDIAHELGIGLGVIDCVTINAPDTYIVRCYTQAYGALKGPMLPPSNTPAPGYQSTSYLEKTAYGRHGNARACINGNALALSFSNAPRRYGRYQANITIEWDRVKFRVYPNSRWTQRVYDRDPGEIEVANVFPGSTEDATILWRLWCAGTARNWNDAGLTYTATDCGPGTDDPEYECRNSDRNPRYDGRPIPAPYRVDALADADSRNAKWKEIDVEFTPASRFFHEVWSKFRVDPESSPWLTVGGSVNDANQPFAMDPNGNMELSGPWIYRVALAFREAGTQGTTWDIQPLYKWRAQIEEHFLQLSGYDANTGEYTFEDVTRWVPTTGLCEANPLKLRVIRVFGRP